MNERFKALARLQREWVNCHRCPLGRMANQHVLFELPPGLDTCDVLFIGEAPGWKEDDTGVPFKGKSGTFLRDTIERARPRPLTYGFANILACRPTDADGRDRKPARSEVHTCRPRLIETVQIIQPRAIVGLGKTPQDYLPEALKLAGWRGLEGWFPHPAYLLRSGGKDSLQYPAYQARFEELFETLKARVEESAVIGARFRMLPVKG